MNRRGPRGNARLIREQSHHGGQVGHDEKWDEFHKELGRLVVACGSRFQPNTLFMRSGLLPAPLTRIALSQKDEIWSNVEFPGKRLIVLLLGDLRERTNALQADFDELL